MNRRILLVACLLLIIGAASADARTLVYKGWVYSGTNVSLNGTVQSTLLGSRGTQVIFKSGTQNEVIDLNECKISGPWEYCFNHSEYLIDTREYKGYMLIYNVKPDIVITRSISKSQVKVGERTTFTVSLRNDGERRASGLVFREDLPSEVMVDSVKVCKTEGNDVVFIGDIEVDETVRCEYTVYPSDELDVSLTASVTYNDGLKTEKVFSKALRLYTIGILGVKTWSPKAKIKINEPVEVRINLTNNAAEVLDDVVAVVQVPAGLHVIEAGIMKEGDAYRWEGEIATNKTKSIYLKVAGRLTGSTPIYIDVKYKHKGTELVKSNIKHTLTVENDGISLSSLIPDSFHVDSGDTLHYTLSVTNLNKGSYIKNVKTNVTTGLGFVETTTLTRLDANRSEKIYDIQFIVPEVTKTSTYNVDANVTYFTEYGEKNTKALKRKIIIDPIKKIEVTKKFEPAKPQEGQDVTVTVEVKNTLNKDLTKIFVYENLPPDMSTNGQTSGYIDLKKGEKKVAYTYKIKAPDLVPGMVKVYVNSTAAYLFDGKDHAIVQALYFTVVPKSVDVDFRKSIQTIAPAVGEITDVSYTLENKHKDTIYNITVFFTEDPKFDVRAEYSESLASLDSGEKATFLREKIISKVKGKAEIAGSVVRFQDSLGREFNKTSNTVVVEVKESFADRPLPILSKYPGRKIIEEDTNVTLIDHIANTGTESLPIRISDGSLSWELVVKESSNKSIEYVVLFDEVGTYHFPRTFGYYSWEGVEHRAVSPSLKVTVIERNTTVSQNFTTYNETKKPETLQEIYKKSLLKKFMDWLLDSFRQAPKKDG